MRLCCRRFLRETLKMSNAEDLNRLTACSLVLLGHIFYVLGNHRVRIKKSLVQNHLWQISAGMGHTDHLMIFK